MSQTNQVRGTATTVSRTGGIISVVYHSTEVVRVEANGDITLRNGGWRTSTTKMRMNQASNQYGLGFTVYQKRGLWFVKSGHNEPDIEFNQSGVHVILRGNKIGESNA
jgi:hypothetical protein